MFEIFFILFRSWSRSWTQDLNKIKKIPHIFLSTLVSRKRVRSFSKIYILRKCNKFFRGSRFLKFSRVGGIFFIFSSPDLKRAGFHFQKYKKSFIFRKYKKFLNLRVRKLHFLKCKEFFSGWIFLFFRAWAEKCAR